MSCSAISGASSTTAWSRFPRPARRCKHSAARAAPSSSSPTRRARPTPCSGSCASSAFADDTYDGIVSSGDLTRSYVAEHPAKAIYWLGPERDNSIHRGLDPVFAPIERADYIVCTGPFDDETETAEDYRAMLMQARERKLPLICANPDIVVERGDRLIYCAGAIAELYRELGGEVIFYGKPHRPIYERAMALAQERRGKATPLNRVLAIGDSVRTDLMGAHAFGIDLLFVTRGIHAGEFAGIDQLDPASVKELFGHPPLALMRELNW